MQNIAKMNIFVHFSSGAWVHIYKSWLKSNEFQSFQLILPIVNLAVEFCLYAQKSTGE